MDFFDNGTPLAQAVPVGVGRASFIASSLALGTHNITASYSGDDNTSGAKSAAPLSQVMTGSSQLQITATSGSLSHTTVVNFSLN